MDQPIGHQVNPPIAPANDVYYLMDDLMVTSPPDSQVVTIVAKQDSDWNPTLEHQFQAAVALDLSFRVVDYPLKAIALANHPPKGQCWLLLGVR